MRFTSKDMPILVIIGPSAAGKSSLIRLLNDQGIITVTPTWTTRPPRPGEVEQSLEHRFVSEDKFSRLLADNFFLQTVELFGLPYRYGIPKIAKPPAGQVPLIMLRAMLLPLVPPHYPNHVIYQIEDELLRIEQRLRERQQHGEVLGSRLSDYQKEVSAGRQQAHRVFVNNKALVAVAQDIKAAIAQDFA